MSLDSLLETVLTPRPVRSTGTCGKSGGNDIRSVTRANAGMTDADAASLTYPDLRNDRGRIATFWPACGIDPHRFQTACPTPPASLCFSIRR